MEQAAAGPDGMRLPGQERLRREQEGEVLGLQLPMRAAGAGAEGEEEVLVSSVQVADALHLEDGEADDLADGRVTAPSEGLISCTKTAMPENNDIPSQVSLIRAGRDFTTTIAAARARA